MKIGDLVYIHESFGPMPVDLFGVITRISYHFPSPDDRLMYPPINIELRVFKEKEKICSWYEPYHLMVVEEGYEL